MAPKRPYLVGIGGGTASGKSTLARKLTEALSDLSVLVIGMDKYFKAEKPLHHAPLSGREWPDYNSPDSFHLGSLTGDLDALLGGDGADTASPPPDVVVVEGLMTLQHAPLRERLDLRVFVDAPADERIVRRLRRNMADRGLSFDEIADFYLQSVRFRHEEFVEQTRWYADVVVNGVTMPERGVELLAQHVRLAVGGTRICSQS